MNHSGCLSSKAWKKFIPHLTFKIKELKRQVTITRPYQCGNAFYQFESCLCWNSTVTSWIKYLDWCDFELIQKDTDSMFLAILGEFDEVIKPELREEYDNEGKTMLLLTSKYHDRTPRLFKAEFQGKRMIALQWRDGSEAAGEAPRIMAPPSPQSCFFVSWSRTRIMS